MKALFSSLLIALCLTVVAQADMYTGGLSVDGGGLIASSGWNTSTLSWSVDNTTVSGLWYYEYTLSVANNTQSKVNAPSHQIIEASLGFGLSNIGDITGGTVGAEEIQWYESGSPSNPGLPDSVYGIKFEGLPDSTEMTISFSSNKVPVWGDFYAKAASGEYLYNAGFANPDPLDALANGTIDNHIIRPDSTVVPVPGAMLLASLGLGVAKLGLRRRRRR